MADTQEFLDEVLGKFYGTLDYAMSREQFVPYGRVRDEAKQAILQHFQQEQERLENEFADKYAHPTGDGYCCACDYDLTLFQSEVDRLIREAIRDFKLSPCSSPICSGYCGSGKHEIVEGELKHYAEFWLSKQKEGR